MKKTYFEVVRCFYNEDGECYDFVVENCTPHTYDEAVEMAKNFKPSVKGDTIEVWETDKKDASIVRSWVIVK